MRIAAVTLTLATAALLAACGGSDSNKTATPTISSATTASPAATKSALTTTPLAASATPAIAASATPAPATPQPPAATEPPHEPTTPPAPPPPAPTEAPPPGGGSTLSIAALDVLFDTASLSAPAGPITIVFNNQDTAIAHNIQFFAGSQSIGMTEIATGPDTQTLSLGTLAPGSYFYKCDVHPTTMKGSLKVS